MIYVTLLFLALFLANVVIERRNLWSGLTLGMALTTSLLYLLLFIEASPLPDHLEWVKFLIFLIVAIGAMILLLGPLILMVTFFYNGLKLIQREGFSFRNTLSLGMAIAIPLYIFIFPLLTNHLNPQGLLSWLHFYIGAVIFYFICQASLYTISSLLNMINLPRKNLDYIVVLGAGLIGTEVTPLLASRINKAIKIYRRQMNAKLLMSGGQGPDEIISEAQAMCNYAMKQGVPEEDIILENKSTTTEENVRFSRALMSDNPKFAIVTNSYHIFRALLIARKEKIKCIGYGAPSKFYFSLNAFIREFIAYLSLSRRKHGLVMIGLFILMIILFIITHLILPYLQ